MSCRFPTLGVLALLLALALVGVGADSAGAAIYWQERDEAIGRANFDGTNPDREFIDLTHVPATGEGAVLCGGLAVDAGHLYWADNKAGSIGRASLDGSGVDHAFVTGLASPCGVAVDAGHIYWAAYEGKAIGRANLDGSAVQRDFIAAGTRPCGLTVSVSFLFWSQTTPSGLSRASLAGTEVKSPLIAANGGSCGIATDGSHLYWSDFDDHIARAGLDGKNVEPEFITGTKGTCGVAVHAGAIYWAQQPFMGIGTIGRANLDGSGVQPSLIGGLGSPCGIAVDDTYVPPKPPPVRGEVAVTSIRHNRRARAIVLGFSVNLPGQVEVTTTSQIQWRLVGESSPHAGRFSAQIGPGLHWLKVTPAPGRAGAWPRSQLRRKGWVKFTVALGYVPQAGTTDLDIRQVTLRAPARRRAKPQAS